MTEKRGRGRPTYAPTKTMRSNVAILKAGGMSDDDLARYVGIAKMTLLKHFAEELDTGWAKKRAEVMIAQFKAAKRGNVSAQTRYLARGDQVTHVPRDVPTRKEPALGKKEAALLAAQTPDGSSKLGELMALRASGKAEMN